MSVNGVPLVAAPLQEQGHWYTARLPMAQRYALLYSLGAGQPVVRQTIAHRGSVPPLPATVSRSGGLVINFVGAPPQAGERQSAELTGGSGPSRWGQVLRPTAGPSRPASPWAVKHRSQ